MGDMGMVATMTSTEARDDSAARTRVEAVDLKADSIVTRPAVPVMAAVLSIIALTTSSHAQTGPGSSSAVPRAPATVDAATLSCKQLKDQLQSAGSLTIISAGRTWGDTFYGPGVPQCGFWQRPVFSYVTAQDGRCDAGFHCVDHLAGR